MMQKIPVYIISLVTATARRALIKEHLEGLGIAYEFMDAVRGDALDVASREKINPRGDMSLGAIGCYVSHTKIYERMLEQHIPVALVLEDDAVLHYGVKALIEAGCQSLDFDYCFLGSEDHGDEGFVFFDAGKPLRLGSEHTAYALSSGPYCTHAYLVTLEGARKRMECAFPAFSPIDHYHFLPYKPRFTAVIPMCAFVSEESAVGSMSSVSWSALQTQSRKYWWYYPLRDLLKLKAFRKMRARWVTQFPYAAQWKSFDSAFKVVRRAAYCSRDTV